MHRFHPREARGQGTAGVLAVSFVVLNRVNDHRFPNTICEVVYQAITRPSWKDKSKRFPVKHRCQFSWFCDGKSDNPKNKKEFDRYIEISTAILTGELPFIDITDGATFYHADYVRPSWARTKTRTIEIGDHIFYIDSDTEFKDHIPDDWYNECLPDDVFLTLHERLGYYTETGFLAFNNNIKNKQGNKIADEFFKIYTRFYTKDLIYALPAFLDCNALDATRYRFKFLHKYILEYSFYKEKNLIVKANHNQTNVDENELIKAYFVHKKGNLKHKD